MALAKEFGVEDGGWSGGYSEDGSSPFPPEAGTASNISLISSSGGLTGWAEDILIPAFNRTENKQIFLSFDSSNLDTERASRIEFRQEEVIEGREITITGVRIIYRDLGKASISVFIYTDSQKGDPVEQKLSIGSVEATKRLRTVYFNKKVVTGERPQLIIQRNSGPVYIKSATLITKEELMEQV